MPWQKTWIELNPCLPLWLEVLRLYPPVLTIQKRTMNRRQTIHYGVQTLNVPPNAWVLSHVVATHYHPDHYAHPDLFQPSRWVGIHQNGTEMLVAPQKGAHLAWAEGPQNCPGMKFSKVEFVAVLACLFRNCRIKAVRNTGETKVALKERLLKVVNDWNLQLLLRMRHADQVELRCVKC
jgi:cytochrome P450